MSKHNSKDKAVSNFVTELMRLVFESPEMKEAYEGLCNAFGEGGKHGLVELRFGIPIVGTKKPKRKAKKKTVKPKTFKPTKKDHDLAKKWKIKL